MPHPLRKEEREAGEGQGLEKGDAENAGQCWDRTLAPLRPRGPGGGLRALPQTLPGSSTVLPEEVAPVPGQGLQLAGASGNAAVQLLFCFGEDGIIDCCGCGFGAHDRVLGNVCPRGRARVRVRVSLSFPSWTGRTSAQWGDSPQLPTACISPGPGPGLWPLGAREDAWWQPGMLMVPGSA